MNLFQQLPLKSENAMRAGSGPIVLMTRIRLARNLRGQIFPDWAEKDARVRVLDECREALMAAQTMKGALFFDVEELSAQDKDILVERHLISRELAKGKQGAGICVSQGQDCAVMVNEEDHLRLQVLRPGLQFKQAWKTAEKLDKELEKRLDFAFSDKLGYLTACPTNLGTALRASALMHLPGLVLGGQMEKVVRAVAQMGMTVRGLFGEGSEAHGSMFQISNQQTLGESEPEILRHIEAVLRTIVQQEENARLKLIEQAPEKLFDKIGRCYGTLRYAHVLTSTEALNFLSLMRLAIDLNILPEARRGAIDRLLTEVQPGHLRASADAESGADIPAEALDTVRAAHTRARFAKMPEPDFANAGL